jgi:acetolactate synthase-1/2/3 large subunit
VHGRHLIVPAPRTGGQVLVDGLRAQGVDLVFGVPGESYLAVLDALHGTHGAIRFVSARQEGAASMMAEAYGKLTGRPGVCLVTRAPGTTNGTSGLHVAFQDSTPMVMLIGQVGRGMVDREAFQEVDYRRFLPQLCKWVTQVDQAERLPELLQQAFWTARSGRPGPVALALPEDMLTDIVSIADAPPSGSAQGHPGRDQLARFRALLAGSQRPLALVGGGTWTPQAAADFRTFAETNNVPVTASFRSQDIVDNRLDIYAGDSGIGINPKLAARYREADLLLVAGARLGESTTSGYTLVDIPVPKLPLVHAYPDPEELGRTYFPTLPIVTGMPELAAGLRELEPVDGSRFAEWTESARADFVANQLPPPAAGDGVDMTEVALELARALPDDAVITNGAGNYTVWIHRFYTYRDYRTQLAPTSGSMGYGLPAAIAAKLAAPEREVVCLAGDGCLMMVVGELATAAQEGAAIVVIVANNGMYGTIRMHQERNYPGRVSGTDLRNPDFVALARAFGCQAELVERTDDFADALARAREARIPALIELRCDPEALTPKATLSAIREQALAARS